MQKLNLMEALGTCIMRNGSLFVAQVVKSDIAEAIGQIVDKVFEQRTRRTFAPWQHRANVCEANYAAFFTYRGS